MPIKDHASKGGKSVKPENRIFARNPEFAREMGRKSAAARKAKKLKANLGKINEL